MSLFNNKREQGIPGLYKKDKGNALYYATDKGITNLYIRENASVIGAQLDRAN